MGKAIRKPWQVANDLDALVAQHKELFEETAAYSQWADAKYGPEEAADAKREWHEKHSAILGAANRLKRELKEAEAAHSQSEIKAGKKIHPLETRTDEAFPDELVMLDPMYSDPAHFFSTRDKEQAKIIRTANDEMAKRRTQQKRKRR